MTNTEDTLRIPQENNEPIKIGPTEMGTYEECKVGSRISTNQGSFLITSELYTPYKKYGWKLFEGSLGGVKAWYNYLLIDGNELYDQLKTIITNKDLLVELDSGEGGYIQKINPDMSSLSMYINGKESFKSYTALYNASLNLCRQFITLKEKGFVLKAFSTDNIYVNFSNGDVRIRFLYESLLCERYDDYLCVAPEVICGNKPTQKSNDFILSLLLFRLFFKAHPFQGALEAKSAYLTAEYIKEIYGRNPVFIYSEKNNANRLVTGLHKYVEPNISKQLKQFLHSMFNETESDTQKYVMSNRMDSERMYRQLLDILVPIKLSSDLGEVLLEPGKKIIDVFSVVDDEGSYVLKVDGVDSVVCTTPSGKTKEVKKGNTIPLKQGVSFTINNTEYTFTDVGITDSDNEIITKQSNEKDK